MRTIIKLSGFICMTAILGIISCSDEPEHAELSPAAKQYLSMRMGSNNAMASNMNGPINQSFQSLFNQYNNAGGKVADDSTEIPPDSTIIGNPWQSCAVITETDNEDGSHTTTYDYGDGCQEGWPGYTYFMHGKHSSTYHNLFSQNGTVFKNSYFYSSVYENYGGHYNNGEGAWLLNGDGTYEGESEYDTASNQFSGAYSYDDETTYQYDSTTYHFRGNASTHYNEQKNVVESGSTEYRYNNDYYKTEILEPLEYKYSCYQQNSLIDTFCFFWIYVSGRERIEYKNSDGEGSFEIDYGNGECDNIITIYENGKISVIDLSDNWYWN